MSDFLLYVKIILQYIFLFIIIHSLHTNFFQNNHIIIILIIDIMITAIIGIIINKLINQSSGFLLSVATITFVLLAALYSLLIPTMIDRSITVDMLLRMYQANNYTVLESELKNNTFNSSVISKRLEEQIESGVIVIENNEIKLTKKGRFIAAIFYYNNKVLNIKSN